MERNAGVLLLALGIIVILSLFSGSFSGQASKEKRGVNTCADTDGGNNIYSPGAVITVTGDKQGYYTDRCGGTLSVVENYCEGNKRRFKESFCAEGMGCMTTTLYDGGNRYGAAAYCG